MIHRCRVHLLPGPTTNINTPGRDDPGTRRGPEVNPGAPSSVLPVEKVASTVSVHDPSRAIYVCRYDSGFRILHDLETKAANQSGLW